MPMHHLAQSVILGTVQGLTEFTPISSSAHLVLVRTIFGFPDTGQLFDVMLHLGTLVAAIIYFWKDLWAVARDIVRGGPYRRLGLVIVVATIPGAIGGVLFEDALSTTFRDSFWIGVFLIVMAAAFVAIERVHKRQMAQPKPEGEKDMFRLSFLDGLWIGLAQMVALLPSVSRSGSTILAGLMRGMRREEATRFSFLMSIPIIAGAGLNGVREYLSGAGGDLIVASDIILGFIFSAIFGYLTISFLIRYLAKHSLIVFAWYVGIVGVLVLIFAR